MPDPNSENGSPPAPQPPPSLDDVAKMDRLLKAFKMERTAYLIANLIGVALLVAIAILQMIGALKTQAYGELMVVASATLGSGGLVAFATGRLLRMFNRMSFVLFPQLKDFKDE
jgi:hypothetical protein